MSVRQIASLVEVGLSKTLCTRPVPRASVDCKGLLAREFKGGATTAAIWGGPTVQPGLVPGTSRARCAEPCQWHSALHTEGV